MCNERHIAVCWRVGDLGCKLSGKPDHFSKFAYALYVKATSIPNS